MAYGQGEEQKRGLKLAGGVQAGCVCASLRSGLLDRCGGALTSEPHGLEHMGMCGPRGDEVLLQQEAGHLHNGAEGALEDPLSPVTRQGTGCLYQFIPGCRCHLRAHFWLWVCVWENTSNHTPH